MSDEAFLLGAFRDFYAEVVRGKHRATHPATHPGAATGDVWETLVAQLERHETLAARAGGAWGVEVYREAEYVMAALGDEVFLHLDWPGRAAWQERLLESHLFSSHRAGDEIFRRIDQLLRVRDPLHVDLAKIYLFALALGFEGRYRAAGPSGAERLALYRRDLFSFIANRDPGLAAGARRLVPMAYASTLEDGQPLRLPYLRRWVMAGAVLVAGWLFLQHLLWHGLVGRLDPVLTWILGSS